MLDDLGPLVVECIGASLPAGGHYSPAVRIGSTVYISGQLPVRPGGDHSLASAAFCEQAVAALENLRSVLDEVGLPLESVAKVTVFISDISYWDEFNQIYSEFFGAHRPARSVAPVGNLHFGYKVEIEAIAIGAKANVASCPEG